MNIVRIGREVIRAILSLVMLTSHMLFSARRRRLFDLRLPLGGGLLACLDHTSKSRAQSGLSALSSLLLKSYGICFSIMRLLGIIVRRQVKMKLSANQ